MNFEGALRNRLDADPSTAVGPFAEVLSGADLAIGNLETAIATGGTRADKRFTFRAPANAIDALRAGGFDAVSMANNHGMDFGAGGLAETLAVKRAQADGFVIGIGGDEDEAFAPFRAEVRGQRVAVIAATQVLDDNLIDSWTATATQGGLASAKRVDRLVAEVRAARATSDTVVVFLHWGVETETCPTRPAGARPGAGGRGRGRRRRGPRPPAAGRRAAGRCVRPLRPRQLPLQGEQPGGRADRCARAHHHGPPGRRLPLDPRPHLGQRAAPARRHRRHVGAVLLGEPAGCAGLAR